VLWPMEPVEPRIASFFTVSIFADCLLNGAREVGWSLRVGYVLLG
jgi:hypothetical protein